MKSQAFIELRAIKIETNIGSYGPGAVRPKEHLLDLILGIDPKLVLIDEDSMHKVFDYDPLVVDIQRLTGDQHYETQERLMTRIVKACASYTEIVSLEVCLRKTPVINDSGSLGVRLYLDHAALRASK
jgi:dihydroneopterin aldolase